MSEAQSEAVIALGAPAIDVAGEPQRRLEEPLPSDALAYLQQLVRTNGLQRTSRALARAATSLARAASGAGLRRDHRIALTAQLRAHQERAAR